MLFHDCRKDWWVSVCATTWNRVDWLWNKSIRNVNRHGVNTTPKWRTIRENRLIIVTRGKFHLHFAIGIEKPQISKLWKTGTHDCGWLPGERLASHIGRSFGQKLHHPFLLQRPWRPSIIDVLILSLFISTSHTSTHTQSLTHTHTHTHTQTNTRYKMRPL